MTSREFLLKRIEQNADRIRQFKLMRAMVKLNPRAWEMEYKREKLMDDGRPAVKCVLSELVPLCGGLFPFECYSLPLWPVG